MEETDPQPKTAIESVQPRIVGDSGASTVTDSDTAQAKLIESDADKFVDRAAELFYDDEPQQIRIFERLRAVKDALGNLDRNLNKRQAIAAAEFEIKSVGSLIRRKEIIDKERKRIESFVPFLIIAYISLIIIMILVVARLETPSFLVPVIKIPCSVVAWSAIGSIAAILYRFYTQETGRLSNEIRWLVARPIIGVIMGSIAYLAVISGLLLMTTHGDTNIVRDEVVWIAAFLGGFSDRFFEAVISTLLNRLPTPAGKSG